MSFLLPSCEEIPPKHFLLPTLYLRQNLKGPPASRSYLKELSFFLKVAFMDKNYLHPYALRYFGTNLSLNADVSENTLPFVSQSMNNFSDYVISQSVDWERPSLSPHVLLSPLILLWRLLVHQQQKELYT